MSVLNYKETWAPKNWCFWTVVLEKTLESPLDCKEIQPVHPNGNQFWIFIRRTDTEAETPILWPPDAKNWLIRKDPDAGKDWRQEKGMTEDEMVGWHHRLNGHEFEQTLGVGDGQGSLACCSLWDHEELDRTKWLNWADCSCAFLVILKVFPISQTFTPEIVRESIFWIGFWQCLEQQQCKSDVQTPLQCPWDWSFYGDNNKYNWCAFQIVNLLHAHWYKSCNSVIFPMSNSWV